MQPTDAAPDPELLRLLDGYVEAAVAYGEVCGTGNFRRLEAMDHARAALLAYLDRAYLRLPPPLEDAPVDLEDAAGDGTRPR